MSLGTAHVTMPSGNMKYIVVAIDHFTCWIEVTVLTNETSQSIINFIEQELLMRHGCPKRIKTDGGKPYVSAGINSFFAKLILFMKLPPLTTQKVMAWQRDLLNC